jgi:hypothetical protein
MYEIKDSDCRIVDSMVKHALQWGDAGSPAGAWPRGSNALLSRRIEKFKSLVDASFEQKGVREEGVGIKG